MKLLLVVGFLSLYNIPFVFGEALTTAIARELLRAANDAFGHKSPFVFPSSLSSEKAEGHFTREESVTGHPQVSTTSGHVIGSTLPETHAFYSIPYGIAPVEELRFQAPQPFISSIQMNVSTPKYVRCFEFTVDCLNVDECDKNYSEDCLVLNVNVPSTVDLSSPPSERLPVMVWIHGGAFFAGSGTQKSYDSRWLANSTNTVIVNVNYRLDALGFLNYEENGESFDGNQGFKDQQLALQWVQDNIENFGGDKNMVTIFGNSAGAQSVMLHLVSDKSNPLFKRAIMESNPAAFYYPTKEEASLKTDALLSAINCTGPSFQCLRDTPASILMRAHLRVMASETFNFFNVIEPYRPILDDIEFKEQPLQLYQSGRWQNHKEVIIGTMSEEVGFLNVVFQNITIGPSLFEALTSFVVGPKFAPAVVEEYSKLAPSPGLRFDYTDILAQEISDMVFVCPSRAQARFMSMTASNVQTPPTYLYLDSHPLGGSNCEEISKYCGYASHGSETHFVFNAGENTGFIFSENDTAVAKIFSDFWGYFAHTGKPSEELTIWPPYTSSDLNSGTIRPWTNVRIQAPETFIEHDYRNDLCDFWDSLNFYINATSSTASSTVTPSTQSETTLNDEAVMTTTGRSASIAFSKPVITFAISVVVLFDVSST